MIKLYVDENVINKELIRRFRQVLSLDVKIPKSTVYLSILSNLVKHFYPSKNSSIRKSKYFSWIIKYHPLHWFKNGYYLQIYSDVDILHECILEDRVLLTRDKDFLIMKEETFNAHQVNIECPCIIYFNENVVDVHTMNVSVFDIFCMLLYLRDYENFNIFEYSSYWEIRLIDNNEVQFRERGIRKAISVKKFEILRRKNFSQQDVYYYRDLYLKKNNLILDINPSVNENKSAKRKSPKRTPSILHINIHK